MVEGGSILHADHPRKWVIFARRFTGMFAVTSEWHSKYERVSVLRHYQFRRHSA